MKIESFPLLGQKLHPSEYCQIDLSSSNSELEYNRTSDPQYLDSFINETLSKNHVLFGVGGYAEKRAVYRAGTHFSSDGNDRCIHLGIDIWAKVYTTFYAPLDGVIHSFKNNNLPFDYGGTIILQHDIEGHVFHSLYGHLSLTSLIGLKKGMHIKAGQALCQIGDWHENGGWPSHLHFQIIRDMQGNEGDYIGACTENERNFYLDNCPNPAPFLGIE